MFCKPPDDDKIQRCGSPETMFFQTSDIPEPATWSTMLFGFGLVGYSIRRQLKPGRAIG